MADLNFPRKDKVPELQADLINEFGGIQGLRDEGTFEFALVAAENRHYYEDSELSVLAATYAYHLRQAHAFLDGNKRIGAAVAGIFLKMNNAKLSTSNKNLIQLFLDNAASRLSRGDVEKKIRGVARFN